MTRIYTIDKLDPIAKEAIRGSTAQSGIYVTPMLIRRFRGDGNTTIIFKRLLYCSEQWGDEEGWFFQTAETIKNVTGLGYRALQRSIKRLEKMGLVEKALKGMPNKTHYRINLSAYLELIMAETSFATSAKTSFITSDESSFRPSDETCVATSAEQVILSDHNSDTQNDIYSPISDETDDPDLPPMEETKKAKGYKPGPGKKVSCVDPDTGETVGEPDWRFPQTQIQNQAFNITGRKRFSSKNEYNKMQKIEYKLENGELPYEFWEAQKGCARKYSWSFPILLKSTLNPDRFREWQMQEQQK